MATMMIHTYIYVWICVTFLNIIIFLPIIIFLSVGTYKIIRFVSYRSHKIFLWKINNSNDINKNN